MAAELERQAREQELRLSLAAAGSTPGAVRPPMYPPGFGPAPPPPHSHHPPHQPPPSAALANFAEARRIEELAARASAERQYAEQMSALATDPLVR